MNEKTAPENRIRLRKNTFSQYALQLAKYIFPFITIPYLARVLGPDTYAIRAYLVAVMGFIMVVLDYGFTTFGTKAIAQTPDTHSMNSITSAIMTLRCILCLTCIPAIALLCQAIPIMSENPGYVAIAYTSVALKALLPDFVFQGKEDMAIVTYRFVLTQLISIAFIFLLIHSPDDLLIVPILEVLSAAIALAWSWHNALFKQGVSFVKVSRTLLISSFKDSTVFFVSSAATTLISILSTVFIGIFTSDPAEISYWSLALTAMTAVNSLYTPAVMALYPYMCSKRDFALLKKLMKIGIPLVLIGSVVFALSRDPVMWVLGGEDYMEGSFVMGWIAPVFFFSFISQMCGYPVLAATDKVRELSGSTVIAAGFNVAALLILGFSGVFSLYGLCVIRILTEAILAAIRVFFVL